MPQSDWEDGCDLPSLESLLHRNPTDANPKPHHTPANKKPTESTLQIQGWVEVQGPEGTSVLQELPDHESETQAPCTGDRREGYWLRKTSAQHKSMPISNHSVVATESGHITGKLRRCSGQVPQTPKRQSKRLQSTKKPSKKLQPSKKQSKRSNPQEEEAERHKAQELADAKTEWTRRGYPRIVWQRLDSRLKDFSSALRDVLDRTSSSIYYTELESAATRREKRGHNRKYLGIENATAGYYGPRGQLTLTEHIMIEFKSELRQSAVTDGLIRSIGICHFVMVVLVPELAVMLIKEDMKVSEDSARRILQESTRLGETLHEDF